MGVTSNDSKQRWNKEHYTLVKAYVKPEMAAAFMERCKEDGASMSGKVVDLITGYLANGRVKKDVNSVSYAVNTRGMRRKAVASAIGMIEAALEAETEYMENIPENLQGSQVHDAAEQTVEALDEALGFLRDAYQ